MRISRQVPFAAVVLLGALTSNAQVSSASSAGPPGTVPLSSLIATVAHKTDKVFIIDPRVNANVAMIGEKPSSVTYDQLLTILDTYGFAAVDTGGDIQIVPDPLVRMEPLPFVSGHQKFPNDEDVTAVLHVRSLPAGWLVPILRPLVPRYGFLAAMPCSNDLIIVERFANVRRIETVIRAMDTGKPIEPQSCAIAMPHR